MYDTIFESSSLLLKPETTPVAKSMSSSPMGNPTAITGCVVLRRNHQMYRSHRQAQQFLLFIAFLLIDLKKRNIFIGTHANHVGLEQRATCIGKPHRDIDGVLDHVRVGDDVNSERRIRRSCLHPRRVYMMYGLENWTAPTLTLICTTDAFMPACTLRQSRPTGRLVLGVSGHARSPEGGGAGPAAAAGGVVSVTAGAEGGSWADMLVAGGTGKCIMSSLALSPFDSPSHFLWRPWRSRACRQEEWTGT